MCLFLWKSELTNPVIRLDYCWFLHHLVCCELENNVSCSSWYWLHIWAHNLDVLCSQSGRLFSVPHAYREIPSIAVMISFSEHLEHYKQSINIGNYYYLKILVTIHFVNGQLGLFHSFLMR